MSELRQDLTTKSWIIIAPERLKGRSLYKKKNLLMNKFPVYKHNCPFCPNNEDRFENIEILRIPHPDKNNKFKSTWSVKCIENKYKIFSPPAVSNITTPSQFQSDGIYSKISGDGDHNLVIESCEHNKTLATMNNKEIQNIIKLYLQIFIKLKENPHNLMSLIFKNHGEASGASQHHPHSQVVGMRVVPNYIRFLLEEAQRFFDTNGICVFCQIIDFELKHKKRIIYENKRFLSFTPYASSVPYLIQIIPKKHDSIFENMDKEEINNFAECLGITMNKLYKGLSNPDYNLILRNPPYYLSGVPFYHWHIEIIPKIIDEGGFEIGSGIQVNVIPPEEAASHLRKI